MFLKVLADNLTEVTAQCILLFVPPLTECSPECRSRHLKTVERVKSDLKDRLWGWLLVEAGTQMGLQNSLGGVEEGVHLIVAKFGRGTSWRMKLGGNWLEGWRLGGILKWLGEWEVDSGGVEEWVKRLSEGKEKGGGRKREGFQGYTSA